MSSAIYVRYNPGGAHRAQWLSHEYANMELDPHIARAEQFNSCEEAQRAINAYCFRTELMESNFEVVRLTIEVLEKGKVLK